MTIIHKFTRITLIYKAITTILKHKAANMYIVLIKCIITQYNFFRTQIKHKKGKKTKKQNTTGMFLDFWGDVKKHLSSPSDGFSFSLLTSTSMWESSLNTLFCADMVWVKNQKCRWGGHTLSSLHYKGRIITLPLEASLKNIVSKQIQIINPE